MDLFAYMLGERGDIPHYINKYYGPVPRYRGVRLMKYETPDTFDNKGEPSDIWAKYCGKDVIYFHTCCGGCGTEDEDSNYIACGGKEWEERMEDRFLASIDDPIDNTYRDHYFLAVKDDTYEKICKEYEEGDLI